MMVSTAPPTTTPSSTRRHRNKTSMTSSFVSAAVVPTTRLALLLLVAAIAATNSNCCNSNVAMFAAALPASPTFSPITLSRSSSTSTSTTTSTSPKCEDNKTLKIKRKVEGGRKRKKIQLCEWVALASGPTSKKRERRCKKTSITKNKKKGGQRIKRVFNAMSSCGCACAAFTTDTTTKTNNKDAEQVDESKTEDDPTTTITTPTPTCPSEEPESGGTCRRTSITDTNNNDGQKCMYDPIYMGCDLPYVKSMCAPVVTCTCDMTEGLDPTAGSWMCRSNSVQRCSAEVDGIPAGLVCDPDSDSPIPTQAQFRSQQQDVPRLVVVDFEETAVACPVDAGDMAYILDGNNGENGSETCIDDRGDFGGYVEGQQCLYNHIWTGCTYETLTCEPEQKCTCTTSSWSCTTKSIAACNLDPRNGATPPAGLPTLGTPCDPNAPKPEPRLPAELPLARC